MFDRAVFGNYRPSRDSDTCPMLGEPRVIRASRLVDLAHRHDHVGSEGERVQRTEVVRCTRIGGTFAADVGLLGGVRPPAGADGESVLADGDAGVAGKEPPEVTVDVLTVHAASAKPRHSATHHAPIGIRRSELVGIPSRW